MIVTMDIWHVRWSAIPVAVFFMAWHRRIRRRPGVTFAKLLGTGSGRTFTPRDADLRQWAILAVWEDEASAREFQASSIVRAWGRISSEHASFRLTPISTHGRWSRREPFGTPQPRATDRPVVAITRARITWRGNRRFWKAVPPVTTSLHGSPGLLAAIGIGEAPIGLQGTFSLWENDRALRDFAYRDKPHAQVIDRTRVEQWYAEELFARLEVLEADGILRGQRLSIH